MTFPITVPRLKVQHIIDWLEPQLQSGVDIMPGKVPTGEPNRIIGILAATGRVLEMDGLIEPRGFTFQCRGGADNFGDAEDIAYELDSVLLAAPTDFDIAESITIESIVRNGGGPTAAPIPDSQSRWLFQCGYIFRTPLTLYTMG